MGQVSVAARVRRYADSHRAAIIAEYLKLVAGLRAWFQCVVFYGFFHGDVHAGNLMLLDDGYGWTPPLPAPGCIDRPPLEGRLPAP